MWPRKNNLKIWQLKYKFLHFPLSHISKDPRRRIRTRNPKTENLKTSRNPINNRSLRENKIRKTKRQRGRKTKIWSNSSAVNPKQKSL